MFNLKLKLELFTALAAWVATSACQNATITDAAKLLQKDLTPKTKVYFPGSKEFELASTRWSNLDTPTVNVVVVPATEADVAKTVKFANAMNLPFLVYNGAHGAITTLGRMDYGIEIYLNQLNTVKIAKDGQTATFGGGIGAKKVIDTLWAAGKQAVTGTCECVSLLGPALGGGHGWLQGRHGLIADQFVSMNVVLADGSLKTIDASSDLWWAMKGAGHNFGIVTSLTSKIYDIEHENWAINTLIFTGDKVEALYQAANDYILKNGTQPENVHQWSYWVNIPDVDPVNPIIIFYIIQEGVDVVDPIYTQPFVDIGPVVATPVAGTYNDLAGWTNIALDSPPCQKDGLKNPRFPLYLDSYNIAAQRKAYDVFAAGIGGASLFNNSIFMFEGYAMGGVKAVQSDSTAFAFRDENLLTAPLISYKPAGADLDKEAAKLGEQLRQILHLATGRTDVRTYVNYAFGSETPQQWYGSEAWRQTRLKALKDKYDPCGKFSFYAPVA